MTPAPTTVSDSTTARVASQEIITPEPASVSYSTTATVASQEIITPGPTTVPDTTAKVALTEIITPAPTTVSDTTTAKVDSQEIITPASTTVPDTTATVASPEIITPSPTTVSDTTTAEVASQEIITPASTTVSDKPTAKAASSGITTSEPKTVSVTTTATVAPQGIITPASTTVSDTTTPKAASPLSTTPAPTPVSDKTTTKALSGITTHAPTSVSDTTTATVAPQGIITPASTTVSDTTTTEVASPEITTPALTTASNTTAAKVASSGITTHAPTTVSDITTATVASQGIKTPAPTTVSDTTTTEVASPEITTPAPTAASNTTTAKVASSGITTHAPTIVSDKTTAKATTQSTRAPAPITESNTTTYRTITSTTTAISACTTPAPATTNAPTTSPSASTTTTIPELATTATTPATTILSLASTLILEQTTITTPPATTTTSATTATSTKNTTLRTSPFPTSQPATTTTRTSEATTKIAKQTTGTTSSTTSDASKLSTTDCGTPPGLLNGYFTKRETTFDSSIDYTCIPGYDLSGNNTIVCHETGKWSELMTTCKIKNCNNTPTVANGKCIANTTTYQAFAQCRCDVGYTLHGDTYTECLASGSWSNVSTTCKIEDCGPPSDLLNGSYIQGKTTFNSSIEYSCNNGYDLNGNNTIVCLENGNWSELEATCNIRDCNVPKSIANGECIANITTYQSKAECSCDVGYTLHGDDFTECLFDGSWSGVNITCIIKDCGNSVVHPLNGMIKFLNDTTYLSVAKVVCTPGYRLQKEHDNNVTSEYIQCTSDRLWQVSNGCELKDCGPPPTGHLSTVKAPRRTFNSSAVYTCNRGYSTHNNIVIVCNEEGLWSGAAPICSDIDECLDRKTCHYNANCNNTDGSFKCECQSGYRDLDGVGGQHCADIDECSSGGDVFCATSFNQTRVCVNIDGGYVCVCNKGFTGSKCESDIDECNHNTSCGGNADCSNTFGRFTCACREDFPQGNPYLGCFEPVILEFSEAGDRYKDIDDEIIKEYQISRRLPYFGEYVHWFRPSMDGFMSLDFQPLYNQYGGENATEWKAAGQNHKVIAPLWTNLDSRNITDGGLWIHVFTEKDKSDVVKIQDLIRMYTKQTEFNVSIALVATWKHVTIHSPYEPGYELVKHQNLSMQCILMSDGMYTYIMFNYDQEQFSIRPLPEVPVASGYTHLDYTGTILSDRHNFTNLNKETNVVPGLRGRWLYNVTFITDSMKNEILCQTFYRDNNVQLKAWIQNQLEYALPCPCQEVLMLEDYTFTRNDSLRPGFGSHMTCYESWFFSAYGIKQRCCYMFSKLQTQYPGAIATEFDNQTVAELLETGYNQCCSPGGSQKNCHLYQSINPPDDCSRYTISDEIPTDGGSMQDDFGVEKEHEGMANDGILGRLVRSVRKMVGL